MKYLLKKGDIVESKAGHDIGRIYVVAEVLAEKDEGFVLLADGEYRALDKKKRKRDKHLRYLASAELPDKIKITDVKKVIKDYKLRIKKETD